VIVFSLPEEHPAVRAAVERRLPIVRVDMDGPPGEPVVRIDDRGGARAVAEHVLGLGHRRIAILADRLIDDDVSRLADRARRHSAVYAPARERLAGYADAGLDLEAVPVFDCAGNTIEDGRTAAVELLADPDPPTALLCMTDQLARGALRAAPHLSVAGFDDLPVAAEIGLTTVHQDHVQGCPRRADAARAGHRARDHASDPPGHPRLYCRAESSQPRRPVRRSAASGPQLPCAYGTGAGGAFRSGAATSQTRSTPSARVNSV